MGAPSIPHAYLWYTADPSNSDKFTQAISVQPDNHILYSNRSAAYASKKDWDNALADAEKTTQIKPDWPKGWGRKGAALHGKGDLVGANDAYEAGLKHDANNAQLKNGLAAVQRAMEAEASTSFEDNPVSSSDMY
jgi:stress-induced-phosphoprotein 1